MFFLIVAHSVLARIKSPSGAGMCTRLLSRVSALLEFRMVLVCNYVTFLNIANKGYVLKGLNDTAVVRSQVVYQVVLYH